MQLNVNVVKAGTELDGFDVSYRVTLAGLDTELYTSRFADKAVMKAVVLTADGDYQGASVSVTPEVAHAAGVANLGRMVKASKFDAISSVVAAPVDAAQVVDAIKAHEAQNKG